jgi:hypothetical protein
MLYVEHVRTLVSVPRGTYVSIRYMPLMYNHIGYMWGAFRILKKRACV